MIIISHCYYKFHTFVTNISHY